MRRDSGKVAKWQSGYLNRRGIVTVETAVHFAAIIGALLLLVIYVQRAKQGQMMDLVRSTGQQLDIRDQFRMQQQMVNSTEDVNYRAVSPMYHAPFLPPQHELPLGGTANVMGLVSLPVGPVPREATVMSPTSIHADWHTEEESNYCDDRDPGGSC